jgi:hypothetical protein
VSTGAHPPEVEAQQQLVTGLLQWLYSLESEAAWSTRLLTVQPVSSGQVRYQLTEQREDGEYREADVLSEGMTEVVRTLQQYMYSPTGGAWLTADLSVTSAGQGDAKFNYTDEPTLARTDELSGGMPPEEVAAHLQTFPRPAEAVPAWMQRKG